MQAVRLESGEARAVCADLQPGKLSPQIGTAVKDQTLVPSESAGEADQDRGKGRHKRSLHHLPNGGGGGLQGCLRGNPDADQSIAMLYRIITHRFLKSRCTGPSKHRL